MLAFSIFVSGSFTFGSLIANEISPELLTFYRFLLATIILGVILYFNKRIYAHHLKNIWRYFVLGAIYSIYFVFMFVALKYTTTVSTAAIFTLLPLFAALLERLFLKKSSPVLIWAALILSGMGALWIIFEGSINGLFQFRFEKGEAIFLVGTICYASYAIIQPKLFEGENIYVTTLGVLAAGSIILALSLILQQSSFVVHQITFEVFLVIFYLAIFASIAAYFAWNKGVYLIGPNRAGLFLHFIPVFAAIWAITFLNESFAIFHIVGVFFIITGIILSNIRFKNEQNNQN